MDLYQLFVKSQLAVEGDPIQSVCKGVVIKTVNNSSGLNGRDVRSDVKHEFEVGKYLSNNGINVPQYYDFFKMEYKFLDLRWGLLMQEVVGVNPSTLDSYLYSEAKRQLIDQHSKIKNLGVQPSNDSSLLRNSLFNLDEGKLYLFDLAQWEKL